MRYQTEMMRSILTNEKAQEIIDYAQSLGKPVQPRCSEEEYATACNDFYDKVME